MSAAVHNARPSSLPLPKTISHSSPAERFAVLRRNKSCAATRNLCVQQKQGYFRSSIIYPGRHERLKLTSTSSSTGSTTPTTPSSGGYERQVKSLTPDRDFLKDADVSIRKVSSSKALKCPPSDLKPGPVKPSTQKLQAIPCKG